MAGIHQLPDSISLSGNLKKYILSSGGVVSFVLKDGGTTIFEASYEPGTDGRVTIDVKDIVEARLSYLISHNNFYEQPSIAKTFTAIIDGAQSTFRAIRSGVENLSDTTSNWLRGNFLTWQPANKQVTYYSPEWLTYYAQQTCTIKLKATFPDNTEQIITLGSCEAGKAFTSNVQYAVVSGLLGQKYPQQYEVYAEASGTRLSYIQRYFYSDIKSHQEQWFLFENSLGGLDTVRAYGDTDFTGTHEHKISNVGDIASEYDIDTTRSYNKNTGYLAEYERRWLLDFFPAHAKYIYTAGALRAIAVTESDVSYSASDLPSSYNFKYIFSETTPYLNLIRNEESIPESITIPNIDSPNFHLPPRLSEYPRVPLHEGVILPAFDPHSDEAKVTTIGAILQAAVFEVFQKIEAGEGGGELVNILRSTSSDVESDYSVFSSLRTIREIQKYVSEKTNELIKSTDTQTELTDENTLSSLRALLEIQKYVSENLPKFISSTDLDAELTDENALSSLRALLEIQKYVSENLPKFISSTDLDAELTDENVLTSLRTLLEIQKYVSENVPEFIKSTDTQTELTDENVLTSLRTLLEISNANEALLEEISRKFLRKDIEDTAREKITFLKGIIASDLSTFTDLIASGKIIAEDIDVKNHLLTNTLKVILQADLQTILLRGQMNSETFASGFLGHGMRLRKNGENWELELDNIIVRKSMTIYELIVQEIRYQAGQHIFGPAGAKLTKVTDNGSHWRCEHDGTMDFITGAQVLCQRFKVGSRAENPDGSTTFKDARVKRYWRLVTNYGSGWFNLSKTDCESGSAFPEIDDQVAVLGHRTNPDWQNAIMLVSTGSDAPYMAYYAGINSYSTVGKEVKRDGNLGGIVDAQFGQLKGFGSYAENVYLKGQFRLNNNKLIEDAINDAHDKQTIGAYNLLREYDARFEFKYWGEDGEKVEVDFNEINPHTVMVLCDRDNVIVTEKNLAIKIIL